MKSIPISMIARIDSLKSPLKEKMIIEGNKDKWINLHINDIHRGHHLYVKRKGGLYYHHGIMISADDMDRLDRSMMSSECSERSSMMIIEENIHGLRVVNIDKFCIEELPCDIKYPHQIHRVRYGVPLEVYNRESAGTCFQQSCFDEDTIVNNAIAIFNNSTAQDIWKTYCLVFRNCEQFAFLCCTNFRTLGEQIPNAIKVPCFGLKSVVLQ